MHDGDKTRRVLHALAAGFLSLGLLFLWGLWGKPQPLYPIPLVDTNVLSPATIRASYAELIRTRADLSDFDCYACHEEGKPPPLRYDANHKLIIPEEHSTIIMAHGRHDRNNNCFNCHNEHNLELLQTRDGRELKLSESTPLCGSCHGPTYRDWEAGVHGRTGGYWNLAQGERSRHDCVDCHNPHQPKIPPRRPAPGPHPLHVEIKAGPATPH
jgi:hypothetical protein